MVFNKNWISYKTGFGSVCGKYWLGLEKLHQLTTNGGAYSLRVEVLSNTTSMWYSAEYWSFVIVSESQGYAIHVFGYSGDAGDAFNVATYSNWVTNGMMFSTPDRDNTGNTNGCSSNFGWWLKNCGTVSLSSANVGFWGTLKFKNIAPDYYVSKSRMMLKIL